MEQYQIIVFEPDPDFRESLALMLNYSFEFKITGRFKNSKTKLSGRLTADIILASVYDLEELMRIKKLFPKTPVVAITTDETDAAIVSLLISGAAHYIFKGSEPGVYLSTLKEVLTGEIKIKDSVVRKLMTSGGVAISSVMQTDLTSRERQILSMLASGFTYQKISEGLFISIETVKRHCHNIYKKLGVKNRTEAVNKVGSGFSSKNTTKVL